MISNQIREFPQYDNICTGTLRQLSYIQQEDILTQTNLQELTLWVCQIINIISVGVLLNISMIVIMIDAKNLMDGIDRYRFMTTAILLCFYLFVPLVVTITGVGCASKLNMIDCGGSGLSKQDSDAYIAEMYQLNKLLSF